MKILNPGSHDISQKLKQTKCILFKIWRLKFAIMPKKSHLAKLVFWSISLKNEHLVCLSFWDISRDPGFRIFILTQNFPTLTIFGQTSSQCTVRKGAKWSADRRRQRCGGAAVIETPASGGQPPARTLKTQYSSPLLSLGSVCPQVLMAKNTPQFKPRMVAQPRGPLFRPTCTRTVNTSTVKDSSFQGVPILYVQFLMNFWLCAEITFSHCKSINDCS